MAADGDAVEIDVSVLVLVAIFAAQEADDLLDVEGVPGGGVGAVTEFGVGGAEEIAEGLVLLGWARAEGGGDGKVAGGGEIAGRDEDVGSGGVAAVAAVGPDHDREFAGADGGDADVDLELAVEAGNVGVVHRDGSALSIERGVYGNGGSRGS